MKYIDAELLRKKVKKLDMESCISEEWSGFYYAIDSVLELLDSLQQEQPEVELEKEIEEHIKECLDVKFPTTDIELIKKDVAYTARKFYELGLNSGKEE